MSAVSSIKPRGDAARRQAFVRDGFGQYRVESRNTVGCGHDRNIVFKGVHAADFSAVERFLSRQGEIGFFQSVLLDFIGAADRLRGAMLPNVRRPVRSMRFIQADPPRFSGCGREKVDLPGIGPG